MRGPAASGAPRAVLSASEGPGSQCLTGARRCPPSGTPGAGRLSSPRKVCRRPQPDTLSLQTSPRLRGSDALRRVTRRKTAPPPASAVPPCARVSNAPHDGLALTPASLRGRPANNPHAQPQPSPPPRSALATLSAMPGDPAPRCSEPTAWNHSLVGGLDKPWRTVWELGSSHRALSAPQSLADPCGQPSFSSMRSTESCPSHSKAKP